MIMLYEEEYWEEIERKREELQKVFKYSLLILFMLSITITSLTHIWCK
jgi:hypothetical protein